MAEPMKIRATMEGDAANIKVLMNHVMETGQRKDAKTGQLIPAHFIQTVSAQVNGKTVLEAQWSQAVSKNPFLGFKVKGAKAGDKVTVSWADNKGEKNSANAVVA
jgi:sulfur-oxidizing protein SoxZ